MTTSLSLSLFRGVIMRYILMKFLDVSKQIGSYICHRWIANFKSFHLILKKYFQLVTSKSYINYTTSVFSMNIFWLTSVQQRLPSQGSLLKLLFIRDEKFEAIFFRITFSFSLSLSLPLSLSCWGGGLSGTRVQDIRSIGMVYISVQSFARFSQSVIIRFVLSQRSVGKLRSANDSFAVVLSDSWLVISANQQ